MSTKFRCKTLCINQTTQRTAHNQQSYTHRIWFFFLSETQQNKSYKIHHPCTIVVGCSLLKKKIRHHFRHEWIEIRKLCYHCCEFCWLISRLFLPTHRAAPSWSFPCRSWIHFNNGIPVYKETKIRYIL